MTRKWQAEDANKLSIICKKPSLLPPQDSLILQVYQKEHLSTVVPGHDPPPKYDVFVYRTLPQREPSQGYKSVPKPFPLGLAQTPKSSSNWVEVPLECNVVC